MIYNCLTESANLGLTITDIANDLEVSRNTVYKYLYELEADNKIYEKKVGRYKLYYSSEVPLLKGYRSGITSFIKELLANMKKTFPNQGSLFKSFGRNMAQEVPIPFSKEGRDLMDTLKDSEDIELLESIEEFLPHFNLLQDSIDVKDFELKKSEKRAIITFKNSQMLEKNDDYVYYFYILVGLVEQKLSTILRKEVRFDIIDYETFDKKEHSNIRISFDLEVLLPDMEIEGIDDTDLPEKDALDMDLIKTYIEPVSLSYILHGVILKKEILFLLENSFLKEHLINLFEFVFEDSFNFDIVVDSVENYITNKNSLEGRLILGEKKIIKNINENPIREKDIKIEQDIIRKLLSISQRKASLLSLKREVKKAHILAKELLESISMVEQGDGSKIDVKKLLPNLEEKYNIKLTLPYINFLMEIIEKYFEKQVSEILKFFLIR